MGLAKARSIGVETKGSLQRWVASTAERDAWMRNRPEPELVVVKTVASKSRPGVTYNIYFDTLTHKLSCNCPAWVYGPKTIGRESWCKHIREHVADEQKRLMESK